MGRKLSGDVVPDMDLKVNLDRGVAVAQSVSDYETAGEERSFMRSVIAGLADLEPGREVSLADAKPLGFD